MLYNSVGLFRPVNSLKSQGLPPHHSLYFSIPLFTPLQISLVISQNCLPMNTSEKQMHPTEILWDSYVIYCDSFSPSPTPTFIYVPL